MKSVTSTFAALCYIIFLSMLLQLFVSCHSYIYAGEQKKNAEKCFSHKDIDGIGQKVFKDRYIKKEVISDMHPYFLSDKIISCIGLYYYEGFPGEGIRCPCPVVPVLRLTDTYEVWTGDSLTDRRVVDTFLHTYEAYFSEDQGRAITYIFVRGRTHINWEKFFLGEGE